MKRAAVTLAFVVFGALGCGKGPSATEHDRRSSGAPTPGQEETATVERCGPGFWGQMIDPPGQILQRETSQTKPCPGDQCAMETLHMLESRFSSGNTCDEIRKTVNGNPIVDAWGAQVRVICNGVGAQAISAGRDGKVGTCDDLGARLSMNVRIFH
jgi:hypothetical protein